MAQHDYVVSNQSGSSFRADLNNALAAIVSQNSGASEPSTTYAYQFWADTTNNLLKIRNAANSAWITLRELDGTMVVEDGTAAAPGISFAADTNTGIYRVGADQLGVTTNGTQRLVVDSTGQIEATSLGTAAAPTWSFVGDPNTGIYSPGADTLAATTNGTQRITVDSSGRVLVGTSTAPTIGQGQYSKLVVQAYVGSATGAGMMTLQRGQAAASIASGDRIGELNFTDSAGATYGMIYCDADATSGTNDYPGRLVFSTCPDNSATPVERLRIDNAGRVAIGTASPSSITRFQVTQTNDVNYCASLEHTTGSSTPLGLRILYTASSPNNTGAVFLIGADSTATRFELRSNGGLANYSANNANLSDRNAKKDISPAADTWDCIKEWEIVNYRYKDQPDDADLNLGVIAQQVAESCPEVITVFQEAKEATEDQPAQEERLGVKEQQMYWMAIKALQEAMSRIETLEAEVAALKAA